MKKGFSLIEIIIVVAIFSIISAIVFASFFSVNDEKALDSAALGVQAVLEEARSLTLAAYNNQSQGVHFDAGSNIIVRYPDAIYPYNPAGPSNIDVELHKKVQVLSFSFQGGGSEVIFDRLTGDTSQYGTVTVSLQSDTSQTRTITISQTGIVE